MSDRRISQQTPVWRVSKKTLSSEPDIPDPSRIFQIVFSIIFQFFIIIFNTISIELFINMSTHFLFRSPLNVIIAIRFTIYFLYGFSFYHIFKFVIYFDFIILIFVLIIIILFLFSFYYYYFFVLFWLYYRFYIYLFITLVFISQSSFLEKKLFKFLALSQRNLVFATNLSFL